MWEGGGIHGDTHRTGDRQAVSGGAQVLPQGEVHPPTQTGCRVSNIFLTELFAIFVDYMAEMPPFLPFQDFLHLSDRPRH